MKKKTIAVGFVIAMAALSGCGHSGPSVDPSAEAQAQAFLTALKATPLVERPTYIKDHPDGLKSIAESRDKSLMDQYQGVLRSPR